MASFVNLNPKTMSLKETYKVITKNKVKHSLERIREANDKMLSNFVENNNVRISKKEIFNLLYKYQNYIRIDDNTTTIITNAQNKIAYFCERSSWYNCGYKILKCERMDNTQFKLVIDIPFEEIEMMFSNDLQERFNEINRICK